MGGGADSLRSLRAGGGGGVCDGATHLGDGGIVTRRFGARRVVLAR